VTPAPTAARSLSRPRQAPAAAAPNQVAHQRGQEAEGSSGLAQVMRPARLGGVTPRALLIAAALVPLNTWWLFQMNDVWYVANPTAYSFYFNVVFIFALLAGLNALIGRVSQRARLSRAELVVVYLVLTITSSCAGTDSMHWVLPEAAGVFFRATPEVGWGRAFFDHMPAGFTMQDETSLRLMFEGGTRFYATPAAWRPWVPTAVMWAVFVIVLWIGPLGAAAILHRRWTKVERLQYPLIQVPFELVRPGSTVLRSPVFWVVGAIVCAARLVDGLHALYPVLPRIPLGTAWEGGLPSYHISNQLLDRPWNAATDITLCFFPMVIGLGLLLPTELLTSCVFFFFAFKAQQVATRWLGLEATPEFPFLKEQSLGGYVGILVFSLWVGRTYYIDALRQILRGRSGRAAPPPMRYRSAAILPAGCLAIVVFLSWSAGPEGMQPGAGMLIGYAILHWGAYYLLTVVCGRLRAELGVPNHEIERLGPVVWIGNTLGVMRGGKVSRGMVQTLTVGSVFFALTRGMRSIPFPHQVEGLKLLEDCGGDGKRALRVMAAAVALGVVVAWGIYLPTVYHYGAGTARMIQYPDWQTHEAYSQLMGWIQNPKGVQYGRLGATGIGLTLFVTMMSLKTRLLWWPLHPLGYALASSYGMLYWWCPFLIALAIKGPVIRYGGHAAGRQLRTVCFALILGDTMGTCLWALVRSFVH
jgi:hypothetical protein